MISKTKASWLGAAVLATLLLAACSGGATQTPEATETETPTEAATQPADGDSSALEGTGWVLTDIDGNAVDASIGATMTFEPDRVTGNGGCNGYGGTYVVEGSKITFMEIVSTLMACDDPKMAVETPFLGALQGDGTFTVTGDTLVITMASGTKLTFAAQ
jgi:putative lipoprotein